MGNPCCKFSEHSLKTKFDISENNSSNSSVSRSASVSPRGIEPNIRDFYRLGRVLGSGQFGKVRKATSLFNPSFEVAVKTISKTNFRNLQTFITEVEILRSLDHPNIIKIYETFEDQNAYHIVMELCTGRELLLYLSELGYCEENIASEILMKILSIVNYMHKNGVCHRDLKLENFVGVSRNNETDVKLIDFGLSKKFSKNKQMGTVVGSLYYVAPEVLSGHYSEKCDLWSCGIILYMVLSGKMPFSGWDAEDLIRQISTQDVEFKGKQWDSVSELAKDLCAQLLNKNSEERLSAEQALKHPWFMKADQVPLDVNVLMCLKNFRIKSVFQREALNLISRTLKSEQIESMNRMFYSLDLKKNGFLGIEDIKQAILMAGLKFAQSELEACLKGLDINGDGVIQYSEFLVAALHSRFVMDEALMQEAFAHFHQGSEKFNLKDLNQIFAFNCGVNIEDVMEELKVINGGEITFEDFKKLILTS